MKRLFIIIIFPIVLLAQYERPGSAGGQFLKIGVNPRASAMAEAYISVTDGAEAVYYNPAAMVYIPNMAFSVSHFKWFANIKYNFISGVINLKELGSFGFIFSGVMTDDMAVRTPLQPDGTGETFYSGYYRFGLAYGRQLTDNVSFGGTLNYIHGNLYQDLGASAVSADISTVVATAGMNGKVPSK